MKSLIVLFLFLRASSPFPFGIFKSSEYSCELRHDQCVLRNVVLESEEDLEQAVFQNTSTTNPLTIESGKIPHFTRKLSDKLAGIVDLVINGLEVQTLYVKPEMAHLEASRNQINTLEVDDDVEKNVYQMLTLDLSGNKLSDVQVLSRFNKLRQLNLEGNQLDHLAMNLFEGMPELRKLSLANNILHTVETSRKMQLLKLQSLSLAGNQLIELDVTMWDLPSLKQLDVSNNKLFSFGGSLDQFSVLDDFKLAGNFWNCIFLDSVAPRKTLKLDADDPSRCRKEHLANVVSICCTHDASVLYSTDVKNDYGLFNDKWDLLNNLQNFLNAFKNDTEQKFQQIGKLPDNLTLIERIEEMATNQQQILEKLNDRQKSVALKEIEELRSIITDHKSTITGLESKLSDLESQMDDFSGRLSDMQSDVKDKLENIPEKLKTLEQEQKEQAALLNTTTNELKNSIDDLGKQQFRYHLSTVDLKSKIGTEQGRFAEMNARIDKLIAQNEVLRSAVALADQKADRAWEMLDSISEGKEY